MYCLLGIFPPTKLGTSSKYCWSNEWFQNSFVIYLYGFLAPPSPPVNLQIKSVTSRSATIQWEPPESNGGTEITGYVVEKKLEYIPKWEKVVTLEAFSLEYTLENLKEKSEYLFRVFAENGVGLSVPATTEVVQLRTHASKQQIVFCFFATFYLNSFLLRSCTITTNSSIRNKNDRSKRNRNRVGYSWKWWWGSFGRLQHRY